jgi:hypothetical protein
MALAAIEARQNNSNSVARQAMTANNRLKIIMAAANQSSMIMVIMAWRRK